MKLDAGLQDPEVPVPHRRVHLDDLVRQQGPDEGDVEADGQGFA